MSPIGNHHTLSRLRVTPLQLLLEMQTDWHGPATKTILLRSGLGYHLRERECLTQASTCQGCLRKPDCWYAFAFDTPREILPASPLKHTDAQVSHPFYLAT